MITSLDHLVLTVRDLDATVRFYVEGLGMELRSSARGARRCTSGARRSTCISPGASSSPRRRGRCRGRPICACYSERPVEEIARRLQDLGYALVEGPVARAGASGPLASVYFRDPDGNLVEIANPASE